MRRARGRQGRCADYEKKIRGIRSKLTANWRCNWSPDARPAPCKPELPRCCCCRCRCCRFCSWWHPQPVCYSHSPRSPTFSISRYRLIHTLGVLAEGMMRALALRYSRTICNSTRMSVQQGQAVLPHGEPFRFLPDPTTYSLALLFSQNLPPLHKPAQGRPLLLGCGCGLACQTGC